MYIETSHPRNYEDTARLVSPTISGKTCLEFYYYMWGDHINELRVYKNNGKGETLVWHLYGDQGQGWKGARVPIDKSTFQVRCRVIIFTAITRMLIDDSKSF